MNENKTIAKLLQNHDWIFAKTMPESPHWYTLRKNWVDKEFVYCVTYIRNHGYQEKYKGRWYTLLNINGFKYWTMGAPINDNQGNPHTILINRAKVQYNSDYDKIAGMYDSTFNDEKFQEENRELIKMINPQGHILDIGCGTGLFLDYYRPIEYTGIDISEKMIQTLKVKHPDYSNSVIVTSLDDFFPLKKYDTIISLFGTGSYLTNREIEKIRKMSGRKFIMFYANGYTPITHIKLGISPTIYTHKINNEVMRKFNKYLVWNDIEKVGNGKRINLSAA